jgi:hypothetical protein
MGDRSAAASFCRQALQSWRVAPPLSAHCLEEFAKLYRDMGDDAAAEPLYQEAQALRAAAGVGKPAVCSDGLGWPGSYNSIARVPPGEWQKARNANRD